MTPAVETARSLTLRFGVDVISCEAEGSGISVGLPVPVLWGATSELIINLPPGSHGETSRTGEFQILQQLGDLGGVAVCPIDGNLEEASFECYRTLFALLGTAHHPYRVWHYVSAINDRVKGLENYQTFNIGRRRAFDDHFGEGAEAQMPAASAVGIPSPHFVMAFVAGSGRPRFLENPRQTPAYHYPQSYGPKSPSFARAAVTKDLVYISGTASIRGHETVRVGDIDGQLEVTVENLELLVKELDYDSWEAVTRQPKYALKVYLRHATDLPRIQGKLERQCRAHNHPPHRSLPSGLGPGNRSGFRTMNGKRSWTWVGPVLDFVVCV